jgi:hypothetical protein
MKIFYYIILKNIILIIGVLILGLIVYFISRTAIERIKKRIKGKGWYLQLFLSREDAVSQLFFLFSIFFLAITLLAFNRDLGDPLSWRTILLFTSIIGIMIAYYFKVIYTLAVSLIAFTVWWHLQALEWIKGEDIKTSALFTGLLFIATIFYLLGRAHEKDIKFKRVSVVYSILGLLPITSALFYFSTKCGLITLEEIIGDNSFFSSWEIAISLFIFFAFIIGILIYALSKKLIFKTEALTICILILLFGSISLLPKQTIFLKPDLPVPLEPQTSIPLEPQTPTPLEPHAYFEYCRKISLSRIGNFWATIFNILVLIETLGLVILGHLKKENWLRKLGLLCVFLLFLVKFVDWNNYWSNDIPLSLISLGVLIFSNCGLGVYFLVKSLERSFNIKIEDKIYSILGVAPLTFLLFFLSSKEGLNDFSFDIVSLPSFSYLLILAAIYLLLNLVLYIYCFKNKINLLKEMSFSLVFLFLLTLIIFAFPHKNLFIKYNKLSKLGIFWAIVFNIMLFLEIVGILFLGYLNKKNLFINLSVFFISILILVKYFDWFFTFLDKSIFFIGAGILLFAVGWFMEKGRGYLLSTIKKEKVAQNE